MGLLQLLRGRPPLPPGQAERFAQGAADLAAGRLPGWVRTRLDEERAGPSFGGPLSAAGAAALRSIGYEPAGQVFGTATYAVSRVQAQFQMVLHPAFPLRTQTRGIGAVPISWFRAESACRKAALRRLVAEVTALGADGAIAVQSVFDGYHGSFYECSLQGLAVRRTAGRHDGEPFVAHVSPAEFRSLRVSGWRPVTMHLDIRRFAAHADTTYSYGFQPAVEMSGASDLVRHAVDAVRRDAESAVRSADADGMIVASLATHVEHERCEFIGMDFTCDAWLTGTSIVRAPTTESSDAPVLPILRLEAR